MRRNASPTANDGSARQIPQSSVHARPSQTLTPQRRAMLRSERRRRRQQLLRRCCSPQLPPRTERRPLLPAKSRADRRCDARFALRLEALVHAGCTSRPFDSAVLLGHAGHARRCVVNAASRASGAAQSALSTKRAHLTAPRSYAAWAAQAAYASASASPVSASRSAGMKTNFHEFVLSMEMPLSWLATLQSG